MISTILGAFRVREIRNKVLFTALVLLLYRIGTYIPAPEINLAAVKQIQQQSSGNSGNILLRTRLRRDKLATFFCANRKLETNASCNPLRRNTVTCYQKQKFLHTCPICVRSGHCGPFRTLAFSLSASNAAH